MPNLEDAEKFEKHSLYRLFLSATVSAVLHKLTDWFGFAALSWSTIVLLGGFASNISIPDLLYITRLTLLIVAFRSLAPFSVNLLTRKAFFKGSLNPVYLCYKDKLLFRKRNFKWMFFVIQLGSTLWTLVLAVEGLRRQEFQNFSPFMILGKKLPESLTESGKSQIWGVFVFLWIVVMTCVFQCVFLLFAGSLERIMWRKTEVGLMKYHDEVMCRGLNGNIVKADEIDVLEFFLCSLGEDLTLRNIGPLEVKRQNLKLLDYLYSHPNGVQVVLQGLVSGDGVRQQTAANMVGFWAGKHAQRLKNEMALLAALAEKLGLPGKTAEAAANSFSELAKTWKNEQPSPLLQRIAADGGGMICNVVEKVMDLVLYKRLPTLLVYIRLLDRVFESSSVLKWLATESGKGSEMKDKLWKVASRQPGGLNGRGEMTMESKTKARTVFLAFSAWVRLVKAEGAMDKAERGNAVDAMSTLNRVMQNQKFLWWDEKERFEELWNEFNNGQELGDWFARCEKRGKEYENLL